MRQVLASFAGPRTCTCTCGPCPCCDCTVRYEDLFITSVPPTYLSFTSHQTLHFFVLLYHHRPLCGRLNDSSFIP
jgi:hypothetical protein